MSICFLNNTEQSWLCGVLSYDCKDWGILRLRDSSIESPGVVCVVAESGQTRCTLSCGDVNVMLVGRWTRQPFYRSKSSCPPILNTPECSVEECDDETLRPFSAWPNWERADSLRTEKEPYLEVAEFAVITANTTTLTSSPNAASMGSGVGLNKAPIGSLSDFEGTISAISPTIPSNTKHALVEIEVVPSHQETNGIYVVYLVLRENSR